MKANKTIYFFLCFWLLVNLLQAAFTQLHFDEAYYWLYSQQLAWGYFDHPPMVALLAKLGDSISHTTLGLRLPFILLGIFSFWGIYHLIENKENPKEIILFMLAFPLVSTHIAGFLTLPDLPLVFFFILYLIIYKQYLKKDNLKTVILFALVITAMVYSKYHGFIILFITILSNPKLLLKKSYWLTGIVAFILFLPHVWWQYQNDFPTFLYHLSDRGRGFQISNFFHHIGSQLLLAGPLSGIFIFWLAIKFKPVDQFEKTLQYIALGFIAFFFIFCLKGRVEAHWTAASTVALIIISYKSYQNLSIHSKLKRVLSYLTIPIIVLIFLTRIVLASDTLAGKLSIKSDFHHWDDWVAEVDSAAQGKPVIFTHKYQNVSRYSFVKNKVQVAMPQYNNRFSQVDLNKIDSLHEGKTVFTLSYGNSVKWQSKNKRNYHGQFIKDYYSYTGIMLDDIRIIEKNDSIFLTAQLHNTTNRKRIFNKDTIQYLQIVYTYNNQTNTKLVSEITNQHKIDAKQQLPIKLFLKSTKNEKSIQLQLGLASGNLRVQRLRAKNYPVLQWQ